MKAAPRLRCWRATMRRSTVVDGGAARQVQVCKQNDSRIITRAVAREMGFQTSSTLCSDAFPSRKRLKRSADGRSTKKIDTNLFESYLENLWMNVSEDKKSFCSYLDCLWFSLYKKGSAKKKVLTWIKQKRIFSSKYVFVPIVCWFVLDIYKSEGREEKEEMISKIPLLVPKVPQQRNGEECGLFVLYFINLFLECAPENFSIVDGYPYFMKEDWFDFEGLESFYKQIHSLCLQEGAK